MTSTTSESIVQAMSASIQARGMNATGLNDLVRDAAAPTGVLYHHFPGGRRLSGFLGWVSWLGLHLVYLMGFRNRANVLVNWAWNYLTYDRAARLLTDDPPRRAPT